MSARVFLQIENGDLSIFGIWNEKFKNRQSEEEKYQPHISFQQICVFCLQQNLPALHLHFNFYKILVCCQLPRSIHKHPHTVHTWNTSMRHFYSSSVSFN